MSSTGPDNWKLTLAYDGTGYHGWQVQPGCLTIQGLLSDAILAICAERVLPQGSGRTDAGVHALGQVATFALAAPLPAENLRRALNRILPASIRILTAERVPASFHARHSAIAKTYEYRIFTGETCPPFLARYMQVCHWPLDLLKMQQAAEQIVGRHDFTSFAASDPDRATRAGQADPADSLANLNVRRIDHSSWECRSARWPEFGIAGDIAFDSNADSIFRQLVYTVRGDGFLHHMVRNLVGTFLDIGRGHKSPESLAEILKARNRALAGPTAPGCGLFLVDVAYGEQTPDQR